MCVCVYGECNLLCIYTAVSITYPTNPLVLTRKLIPVNGSLWLIWQIGKAMNIIIITCHSAQMHTWLRLWEGSHQEKWRGRNRGGPGREREKEGEARGKPLPLEVSDFGAGDKVRRANAPTIEPQWQGDVNVSNIACHGDRETYCD